MSQNSTTQNMWADAGIEIALNLEQMKDETKQEDDKRAIERELTLDTFWCNQ